jgi:hypothetical protein
VKANTPPSAATSQYPDPPGATAMPSTGALRCLPPIEPWKTAEPKAKMPPSAATNQYPLPSWVGLIPNTAAFSLVPLIPP